MTKIPISVFFICKNEADRIAKAILAVKNFAEETIVIDSGSSDETCKIATYHGAKVIFNEWKGYGQQKIFGENQCHNDWVLNLDGDEEVSPELVTEIFDIFSNKIERETAGFRIKIVNKFRFEDKPKRLAYFYNQIRLYNKNLAGFKNSAIHDSVELKTANLGKIKQLNGIVYHQSFRSFQHWIEKINSYSQLQAKDAFFSKKPPTNLKIFMSPLLAFFKSYFIRRYWIYGVDGIIYSMLFAFSRFVKMIKIREIFQENKNH